MKINVFGLGYVGCVSSVCLANNGHYVTGIDIDENKVNLINDGKSPIIEPGLEKALNKSLAQNTIRSIVNNLSLKELGVADVSMVCVGTPSNENGSLNLSYVEKVVGEIGNYIQQLETYHVVVIRSTVLPGTIENLVIPIIEERSGKKAGIDFGICMNPEFLREGTAMNDYFDPAFTLIGEFDEKSGDVAAGLYNNIDAPLIRTNIKASEMVKYSCNAFHALKISFANEIGNICKKMDINSHEVMEIFCKDTRLNLSPYYLKPGFAFGGSCLPKDLRALLYMARRADLETPVLGSILASNQIQIETAFKMVKKTGLNKIGVFGLSFKAGTDDLRESPMVDLIEKLIGKGYSVSIYDEEVSIAKIFGANKQYIETVIPHISSLMKNSPEDVINNSEVIVLGTEANVDKNIFGKAKNGLHIIDLAKISANIKEYGNNYEGICW